jgi:hypothetical protein
MVRWMMVRAREVAARRMVKKSRSAKKRRASMVWHF